MSFDDKARWFDDHYRTTRGRVRLTLLLERLEQTLPPPPARVLDVGGGTGIVSVPLAERGYDVTLLEPSEGMLEVARERIAASDADVDVIQAGVDEVAERAPGPFDAICCHAVLLYLDDPFAPLDALHDIARPRAILSLLEKNGSALAMRPGIKGDYREALRLLDDPVSSGNLRIANVARPPDGWMRMLQSAGWHLDSWVGIRGFSDFPPDDLPEEAFDDLLRLERESGRREPYRSVARLFHMSARAV